MYTCGPAPEACLVRMQYSVRVDVRCCARVAICWTARQRPPVPWLEDAGLWLHWERDTCLQAEASAPSRWRTLIWNAVSVGAPAGALGLLLVLKWIIIQPTTQSWLRVAGKNGAGRTAPNLRHGTRLASVCSACSVYLSITSHICFGDCLACKGRFVLGCCHQGFT